MLLEIGLLKRKTKTKTKQKQKKKKKSKLHKVWAIPVPISTTKDVIYVALMAIFIIFLIIFMSRNVEHSLEKTPRELMERFTNLTHL